MTQDPYQTLGLSRAASDDEIRATFRRLAKELHPDLNPGDSAASDRFKRASAAYEIIGDPQKRRQFDAGEIDASGEPRRGYAGAGAPFEDFGFGDVFSDIFARTHHAGPGARSGGVRLRGQDVRYTLDVEFLEAVSGARKRVTLPEGGTLDLNVPRGVTDGQVLRLRGKGAPGLNGGEQGDALVEVRIRPHAKFKRSGDDILLQLPITLDEAVLGAKLEVPTTEGRVNLTLPKGTSSGAVFRLRGKGVRNTTTGAAGDQLVTVNIVMPNEIDESLAYFFSEWRQKHKYDPGRG